MSEVKSAETVKSLGRAFEIIEYLAKNGEEAGVKQIADNINASMSTVYRQLNTLKDMGYIFQNPNNSKYWLGLRFYMLGNLVKNNLPIVNLMSQQADELAQKYKQTVYIAVPDYTSDFCAQQAIIYKKSYNPIIFRNEAVVGTISPSHSAASGKCMMAYYPESLMKMYHQYPLSRITNRTISDWNVMDRELETIRIRGYALDSEEEEEGKTCIAIPILDSYQNVIASISLSGPTATLLQNPIMEIVNNLKDVGKPIIAEI
ncbi:MAG: IclR family transcriptional regulator [Erysipelotrichaceae bacterium]|nr:IclR family transcriptional regulator [Erysipelotrichaceae bacterium]